MAEDKKARLLELQEAASKVEDPAKQTRLIEEILKLLQEIQRENRGGHGPSER